MWSVSVVSAPIATNGERLNNRNNGEHGGNREQKTGNFNDYHDPIDHEPKDFNDTLDRMDF